MLHIWTSCGLACRGAQLLLAGCSPRDVTEAIGVLLEGVTALGYEAAMVFFYAACDIIALPGKTEGFPYSLLEASASGRAVIAIDVPGTRDAVEHGVTGLLTKLGSTSRFAEALERLFCDRSLCGEMRSRGRKPVGALFSRETVLDALIDFYQTQLLSGTTLGTR